MSQPIASRPSRRLRRSAVLALAAGGLLLGACGDDDEDAADPTDDTAEEQAGDTTEETTAEEPTDDTEAPPAGGGEAVESITIAGFAFDPDPATVEAGAEIAVPNEDSADHDYTDAAGSFETGNIAGGEEGSFTAPEAGEYEIVCTIHPQMAGMLIVL